MPMRYGPMLWVVASLMVASASMAFADAWAAYLNARFGTSAEVPAKGFVLDPPPENDDGRSWTSSDGRGKISIYGALLIDGIAATIQEYRQFELASAGDAGVNVTYQTGKDDWFAYSGYTGDDIVYMKVLVKRQCGDLVGHHLYLKYPAAQRTRYDPIVDHLTRSLRGGGGNCQ